MKPERPDPVDPEPASFFEKWMGMSAAEWETLGATGEHDDTAEPLLL